MLIQAFILLIPNKHNIPNNLTSSTFSDLWKQRQLYYKREHLPTVENDMLYYLLVPHCYYYNNYLLFRSPIYVKLGKTWFVVLYTKWSKMIKRLPNDDKGSDQLIFLHFRTFVWKQNLSLHMRISDTHCLRIKYVQKMWRLR